MRLIQDVMTFTEVFSQVEPNKAPCASATSVLQRPAQLSKKRGSPACREDQLHGLELFVVATFCPPFHLECPL